MFSFFRDRLPSVHIGWGYCLSWSPLGVRLNEALILSFKTGYEQIGLPRWLSIKMEPAKQQAICPSYNPLADGCLRLGMFFTRTIITAWYLILGAHHLFAWDSNSSLDSLSVEGATKLFTSSCGHEKRSGWAVDNLAEQSSDTLNVNTLLFYGCPHFLDL